MLQSENHRRLEVHAMFSFKSFKRKCFIRLMTVLGFGGMVGFCIASCQSSKTTQNQQLEQESPENNNPVQPEPHVESQADNPSPTNSDTQVAPETIENTGTIQAQMPPEVEQAPPEERFVPHKYGIPNEFKKNMPIPAYEITIPYLNEVRQSLVELNRRIQSKCKPGPGTLVVSFTIQKSGKIVHVKSTGGTLKGTEREVCIIKQIRNHRFREFEGSDIPVKYPFKFFGQQD